MNPPFILESVQRGCAKGRHSKTNINTTSFWYGLALVVRKGATLFGNEYLRYFSVFIQWHCTEWSITIVMSMTADSNLTYGGWQSKTRLSFQPTSQRTPAGIRRRVVGRPRTIVNQKVMQYYLNYN